MYFDSPPSPSKNSRFPPLSICSFSESISYLENISLGEENINKLAEDNFSEFISSLLREH